MRRTSTVIARFNSGTSEDAIHAFFGKHDIDGVSVSITMNRYAIEVPVGREKQFIQLFRESGMFADVQDNFLGGERPPFPSQKARVKTTPGQDRRTTGDATEEKSCHTASTSKGRHLVT